MVDQTFPNTHTTTTTVTASSTTVQTNLRYDPTYIRTLPGMLLCAQVVLNFLGFLCVALSIYSNIGRGSFFSSVAGFGFWFSAILLVLYVFHAIEKFHMIPWLKVELIYFLLWALLYLIAATLAAALTGHSAAFGCAAFFGFCALVVYGYGAFLKYEAIRSGQIAQGERHISKTTSAVTSPAY
ncbi:CKLF-like MARVEL transmembrane domain-containing protein 4 [Lycorma delicatula]|uniref:CKLF-like MARVEL transmembrane domain-containing protein 4 n=1 Tax=Lycorma delicatula TaxID=130591 RepID=UPI003F519AB4